MHKVLVSQDDLQLHGGFRGGFSRLYMRAAIRCPWFRVRGL